MSSNSVSISIGSSAEVGADAGVGLLSGADAVDDPLPAGVDAGAAEVPEDEPEDLPGIIKT